MAAIAKAARPGRKRIACSTNLSGEVLAFRDTSTGALGICGHNTGGAATISGTLSNVGTIPTLALYRATSTSDLAKVADVTVTNGTFTTPSIASDAFFYLAYDAGTPPTGTITLSVR